MAPFCSCPVSLVSRILEFFLLSSPGVQSVSFVAPRWAPRPFGGAREKNTPPRFFFAPAPAKGRGRRSPVGRRHGARAKKRHPGWCFFFCSGSVPAPNGASSLACLSPRGRSKKNTPWVVCFFFGSGPAERSRRPTRRYKKTHFAHPGTTAKQIRETNDTWHEQKGATTKRHTLALQLPDFPQRSGTMKEYRGTILLCLISVVSSK